MDEKFSSILSIALIPKIADLIINNKSFSEEQALEVFYNSKTYELLSKEETKLWHLSPLALYYIWDEEYRTGELVLPEGQ